MNDTVIELDSRRPHNVGPCRCRGCRRSFESVVWPTGADLPMECPECKEWKLWPEGVIDPGGLRWACGDCHNDLFYITPDRTCCAMCGKTIDPPPPRAA